MFGKEGVVGGVTYAEAKRGSEEQEIEKQGRKEIDVQYGKK